MTILYDAIIIGNDLSSLIAAEVSSRHGLKTLLLKEGNLPNVYAQSGYTFNIDPLPWSGIGPSNLSMHSYLEKDFFQMSRASLKLLNPGLQIVLPDHRVEIYHEKERLVRDLEREFAGSAARIAEVYETALTAGILFSRYVLENPDLCLNNIRKALHFFKHLASLCKQNYRFLKKMRCMSEDSLHRLFEALVFLFSGSNYSAGSTLFTIPYFLCLPLHGLSYPLGGKHLILASIEDRFFSQGGSLVTAPTIRSVETKTGKFEIEWDTGGDIRRASGKHLVVSAKWKNIRLLEDKRLAKLVKRMQRRWEKILYPFTLHMGVLDKGIPEKMAEYAILLSSESPSEVQRSVFIELSGRGEPGRAPEGKRTLSATIFIEAPPSSHSDEDLRGVASGILHQLECLLPFISENIEFMDVEKCISLSRMCEDALNRKYRIRQKHFAGFPGLSINSNFKNVFLTGDEIFGLGFIGEIISGVNSGNKVAGDRSK